MEEFGIYMDFEEDCTDEDASAGDVDENHNGTTPDFFLTT